MRIPVRLKVHKRLISSISIAESMGLVAGVGPEVTYWRTHTSEVGLCLLQALQVQNGCRV